MNLQALIEEIQKLPPDQKQAVAALLLAENYEKDRKGKDPRSLREVLANSPFSRMEFASPQPVLSPIRPVEL